MSNATQSSQSEARRRWLRLMALSETRQLAEIWDALPTAPETRVLRRPEVGLAMVRGRAGGAGAAFNLGEMTVTRCSVGAVDSRTRTHIEGIGAIGGRDRDKAALIARLDAAYQDSGCDIAARENALNNLSAALEERQATQAAKTAATRVEFFTMERGHT
ncbi:MAG: phosphonate C-P lyase system protein PhnG [Alphaproteobacteria bacterium]|nr:phosphonate C-P lyase system protein PhnG [Alphaproteobacteria bacterium]